jgi:hypothetical protein
MTGNLGGRAFCRNEHGGLSVEFVVLFPLLILVYMAFFVFWDAFQIRATTVRATETIADMMSRETGTFDEAYLNDMHEVFGWLTSDPERTDLRISAVGTTIDEQGQETFEIFWSHATGGALLPHDPDELQASIPTPALGEQLIVLETLYAYAPLFDVGIPPRAFRSLIATRPRYVPQVLWTGS